MTPPDHPDKTVVLGLLPVPSPTRGLRVAHPDRDSPPRESEAKHGGALPIHDTPCKPAPIRKVATEPAIGPHTLSFAENEHAAGALGSLVPLVVQRIASTLVAFGLAALAVSAVDHAGSLVGTDSVVTTTALAAAVVCGALLIVAAVIGMRKG